MSEELEKVKRELAIARDVVRSMRQQRQEADQDSRSLPRPSPAPEEDRAESGGLAKEGGQPGVGQGSQEGKEEVGQPSILIPYASTQKYKSYVSCYRINIDLMLKI